MWTPDPERASRSVMGRFMAARGIDDYAALHRWSIGNVAEFWEAMAALGKLKFRQPATTVFDQPGDMTTATFFADATVSFPEHVLRFSGDRPAIVFRGENGVRREISFDELRRQVAEIAAGLKRAGVGACLALSSAFSRNVCPVSATASMPSSP